jgi:hypothetical protein
LWHVEQSSTGYSGWTDVDQEAGAARAWQAPDGFFFRIIGRNEHGTAETDYSNSVFTG